MKVLIAEDDSVSRQILKKMLSKCGYEVLACRDGAEAWERLQASDRPNLAILDWDDAGIGWRRASAPG